MQRKERELLEVSTGSAMRSSKVPHKKQELTHPIAALVVGELVGDIECGGDDVAGQSELGIGGADFRQRLAARHCVVLKRTGCGFVRVVTVAVTIACHCCPLPSSRRGRAKGRGGGVIFLGERKGERRKSGVSPN